MYGNYYDQYGYGGYGFNPQQTQIPRPQNPYPYSQPPMQQMVQPQVNNIQQNQNFIPLTFVNGLVGAKTHIVLPNTTVYLRDSDSNTLFIKKADNEGKCEIQAFSLKEVPLDKIGKQQDEEKERVAFTNYATKEDISDLKAVLESFQDKLNNLSSNLQKTYSKGFNGGKQ